MGIIDNGGSLEEALAFMNSQRKRIGMKLPESVSTTMKPISSTSPRTLPQVRNREPERKLTVLEQLMENGFK